MCIMSVVGKRSSRNDIRLVTRQVYGLEAVVTDEHVNTTTPLMKRHSGFTNRTAIWPADKARLFDTRKPTIGPPASTSTTHVSPLFRHVFGDAEP
jgi:hypothetical protein